MNVLQPVRIAFVDAYYDTFYGAQRSMFTLVTNLPRDRFEPIVLLPGDGVHAEEYRKAGVKVQVLPLRGDANRFGGVVPNLSIWKKMSVGIELLRYNLVAARWIRENRIDVVYTNNIRSLMYVGLASRAIGKPLLLYIRGDGKPSLLSRLAIRLANRVILIANGVSVVFTANDLQKYRSKLTTLYTGFDVAKLIGTERARESVRDRHGIAPTDLVIGIVGSITRRKGHDLLLRALASLETSMKNLHLMVVGGEADGHEDYRIFLDELIEQLRLTSPVHWVGYRDDVAEYYQAMDILVLPSRSEGLPRVVVEGLASGLPVVASDVGGVREILISDDLGRVVPLEDVGALAQAISSILTSPDSISRSARVLRREYVADRFTIEAYARGFTTIIDSLHRE